MCDESSSSSHNLMDKITLNVITYLKKHRGVSDVQFYERSGAQLSDIHAWCKLNQPYILPDDLINFMKLSDGFLLRWHLRFFGELLPLGCMHINSITHIKRLEVGEIHLVNPPSTSGKNKILPIVAFDLDSKSIDGRLALIFNKTHTTPKIWFQDLSCRWWFIAHTFTDYIRLLSAHLGLQHWQFSFTDVGLNPITKQWMRFFIPERLRIDLLNSPSENQREDGEILTLDNSTSPPIESSTPKKLDFASIDMLIKQTAQNAKKKVIAHTSSSNCKSQIRPGSAPSRTSSADSSLRHSKLTRPDTAHSKRR